jgi:hypothetical protein
MKGANMKSFYLSGPNGSILQLSDGRFADTVGGDTSEACEAHEAMERLLQVDADAQERPLIGYLSALELAAYVGLNEAAITLTEAHEISGIARSTLNEWAREGKLNAWLSGRIWLTTRQALDETVERLRPQ